MAETRPPSANPTGEVLTRRGVDPESARRLGRKADEAERVIGIYGVSVSAAESTDVAGRARRADVERHFRVHDTPTRADPLHRTVELPKPVTPEVAEQFNRLFGRGREQHEPQ